MKLGIIIACHSRVDDLMLHLETLKYFPFPHEVIVIHTMDYEDKYMDEIKKYNHRRINGYGHYIGPLLSAVEGVKYAHELGLDYVVYKNSDDIMYNYELEQYNFNKMKSEGYYCAGYNWLSVGQDNDITLNQVYFDVAKFIQTADDAEAYFKRSKKGYLCELKMARWVKRTCPDFNKQFYRLPGREQEPGIGWERKELHMALAERNLVPSVEFWDRLENNNRFFNLEWQLIGSHDVKSRLRYWRRIRSLVPFGRKIEKDYHFTRFIDAAKNDKPWNIPQDLTTVEVPEKEPKIVSYKIF